MKKGILQRCSRNWEEVAMAPPLQVKTEPIADYDPEPADDASSNLFATSPPPSPILFQVESNKQQAASITVNSNTSNCTNSKTDNNHYCNSYDQVQPQQQQIPQRRSTIFELNHQQRRHQRESMISIRKDYSHKYSNSCSGKNTNPISSTTSSNVSVSTPTVQNSFLLPPSPVSSSSVLSKFRRESTFMKRPIQSSQDSSVKSPISILERYDYDKSKMTFDDKFAKLSELDNNFPVSESAISSSTRTPIVAAAKNKTPTSSPVVKKKKKTVSAAVDGNTKKKKESKKLSDRSETNSNKEAEQVKVIVAQEIVKTEPVDVKPPSVPQSPQSENINKINNKINIIFQLNNDRKNIIWHHHRRAPKKMVQKITIKEANNNTTAKIQSDDVERTRLVTAETQTDSSLTHMNMNMSNSNLLVAEPVEYLFFVDDVLLSLQQNTISFFEFNRLATLLRKGEPDFKVIDTIPRRRHDHLIDADNKFQRLCFNEQNSFPIYVEMRAKQKILDLPEMCPIAFSYCNVYYIDQRRAKFSSVHLDTVKSIINDIVYTCIPGTSYFIMAWNETSPETKSIVTGIVKYKLTPNLDLAKLASIRQFPKLNYRTKQVYCGQASQLITFGDTQVSIFNYESGDLLMSLDLMKSYGTNLTTVAFKENYLFMVYLADEDVTHQQNKRVIVIGVNKCEGNTFKVVHSTPVKLKKCDRIISKSITATNHLLITFSNGHVLMIHLNNFCDIHLHGSPTKNASIFASSAHLLTARAQNIGLRNFAEFFFAAS